MMRQIGSKHSALIEDFIKSLLPLTVVQKLIEGLDEWYPLKTELIRYLRCVFLDNIANLGQDEKQEVETVLIESVFGQFANSFLNNQNLVKYRYNKVSILNNGVFNIYNLRTLFSTEDLLLNADYEVSAYFYVVFGLVDTFKEFLRRVLPD